MTELRKDAPRRYIVDGAGQRVLVGLTIAETIEFETLDNPDTLPGTDGPIDQDKPGQRWLELYAKHEQAWSTWMAEAGPRWEKWLTLN